MHVFGPFEGDSLLGIVHYIFHRRSLIQAVYDKAAEVGASRVYWLTHESNAEAMVLYNKVADRSGFLQYRKML